MLTQEHARTAQEFLVAANREFEADDLVQGSEKLWGAAAHAVMAVAQQRGWDHRSHRSLKNAVIRLSQEFAVENELLGEVLLAGFSAAEKFHRNFYHDDMENYERDADRPPVERFITRILALAEVDS